MLIPIKQLEEPLDKKGIVKLGQTVADDIINTGEVNPLEAKVFIKRMMAFLEEVDKRIGDAAHSEAMKYNEKTFELHGAEVNVCDTYVKYDYSQDHEWIRLNMAETEVALKRKDRENYLKALREPVTVVDEDSGEVQKVFPAVRMAKEGVKILL
jgi:hypothetical protein